MIYLFDYATLKLIWWLFVALQLVGIALLDGIDFGIGTLLPFVAKTDEERRVVINTIAPTWEGNQVWFITAGGALFAAWPLVYAAAFSGFYVALMVTLFALFLRPVGFDYRSKVSDPRWRNAWDWGLFVGGLVPALIFGVAFGNLLLGVPFHFDNDLRVFYTGTFFELLNPFALLAGAVSLSLLIMHGGIYMQMRSEDPVRGRAERAARIAGIVFIVSFAAAGIWMASGIDGYRITRMASVNEALIPLSKTVERASGAWLDNYARYPWTLAAPAAAFIGAIAALVFSGRERVRFAFIASSVAVAGTCLTPGFAMFPFVMPSSSHTASSLTMWDSVSSYRTLQVMFWGTVLFMPVIFLYTAWVYRIMRGTLTERQVHEKSHDLL
jgi:cytochrome d ubiquinol oxidase subunit II